MIRIKKTFYETVGLGISILSEKMVKNRLKKLPAGNHFVSPIPIYVSQFASVNKRLVKKPRGFIKDESAAKRFGATDLKQFSYWCWRACGIACLKAIISTVNKTKGIEFNKTIMDLINEAVDLGGYDIKADKGWYHKALVKIAKKYRIAGSIHRFISLSEIALMITDNKYVLVSVKSDFGGHLLLFCGFLLGKEGKIRGFFFHDPYDLKKAAREILFP